MVCTQRSGIAELDMEDPEGADSRREHENEADDVATYVFTYYRYARAVEPFLISYFRSNGFRVGVGHESGITTDLQLQYTLCDDDDVAILYKARKRQ